MWGSPGAVISSGGVLVHSHAASSPRAHWRLLTEGLWGLGFELSFRVVKERDEVSPPAWALATLERQIRRAQAGGAPPDAHCVLVEAEALVPGGESELGALAFARDPQVPAIRSPHAEVPVWQLVPLTHDEARLVREWSPSGLIEVLSVVDPLLIADAQRSSLLLSPRARQVIEQRVAREGSSLSSMQARVSSVIRTKDAATWRLSKDAVDTLIALLKGRTAHQRSFTVRGAGAPLEVRPGDVPGLEPAQAGHVLKLSQSAARQLRAHLKGRPGRYGLDALPGFTVEVV
ncbi:MAG: suppressor of fused domain protein [Myxococcota bacterium]